MSILNNDQEEQENSRNFTACKVHKKIMTWKVTLKS